jgi:hypothetical protein
MLFVGPNGDKVLHIGFMVLKIVEKLLVSNWWKQWNQFDGQRCLHKGRFQATFVFMWFKV